MRQKRSPGRPCPRGSAPASLHFHLANVLNELGGSDEAIAEYKAAIALDPKFVPPHFTLGNVLKELGRSDEAIANTHG